MNARIARIVAGVGTAACMGLCACSGTTAAVGTAEHAITVTATATASVEPDSLDFSIGIYEEGATATEAQTAASEVSDAIVERLQELGVPAESIQTVWTDVSPMWDENGRTDTYQATTTLQVSEVAIDEAGTLMEAAAEAGASSVDMLEYHTTSYDEAYQQALADAVEASRAKAQALADASGVGLGGVVSLTEGYEGTSYLNASATAEAAADGGVSIEPGQVDVTAQVTVSYEIR